MVMSAIDMVKRNNYQLDEATVRSFVSKPYTLAQLATTMAGFSGRPASDDSASSTTLRS